MRNEILGIGLAVACCFACKKNNVVTAAADSALAASQNNVKLKTETVPLGDYALVWEDQFTGTALNARWDYRAVNTTRGYATVLASDIALTGSGILNVIADRSGSNFSVGQIATDSTFLQKYGYFECSAALNTTEGPHSGFWLQSPTMGATLTPGVDGTEIDIMEHHDAGGIPNRIYHTIHWNGYGANHQSSSQNEAISGIESGYHTFGLEWTPSQYIFYVDGVVKRTVTESVAPISHRSEFVLLTMENTGFGGDRFAGTYPSNFSVDYVRVYKPVKTFIYKDFNFGGAAARLGVGNYTLANLVSMGIGNDALSSISIPPGYKAILYTNDNFSGTSITLTGEYASLSTDFNDKVSSIKIMTN